MSSLTVISESGDSFTFGLSSNRAVDDLFLPIIKHLQHVEIPFFPNDDWNIPNLDDNQRRFEKYVDKVPINLDQLDNRLHLNFLHEYYEKNYKKSHHLSDYEWMHFHEGIHERELLLDCTETTYIRVSYRHLVGQLTKKFNVEEYRDLLIHPRKLDVVIGWNELGKTPDTYWHNKEPDNIDRIKELVQPWTTFNPVIQFYFADSKINKNVEQCRKWWNKHKDEWCNHHKVPNDWKLEEYNYALKIGELSEENLHILLQWRENNNIIKRIKLNK